ncbi:hypothetical protein QYF61_003542 [Mycteria americana]|uniref:Reverse transcriptase domain-containing protein n=1 Tax=Mycteria americana TaxID=33587 RepID=A0AAN7NDR9_MYCAM|nr:hypothetical protein QYF61_003542 [Mycteria americana]
MASYVYHIGAVTGIKILKVDFCVVEMAETVGGETELGGRVEPSSSSDHSAQQESERLRAMQLSSKSDTDLCPPLVAIKKDVIVRPRSIIFECSWQLGEVPEAWRKANVTPVSKKGKKEEPGSYRLVSLTSIPGNVMEQLILDTISRHMKDKKVTGSSQHGFTKGRNA